MCGNQGREKKKKTRRAVHQCQIIDQNTTHIVIKSSPLKMISTTPNQVIVNCWKLPHVSSKDDKVPTR
jgi:hypothetical protein